MDPYSHILNYILSLPRSKTTTYGLHSFPYLAAVMELSSRYIYKTSASLYDFKRRIRQYEPEK